jgi:hypothetical protein
MEASSDENDSARAQRSSRVRLGILVAFLVWILSPWGGASQYWNLYFAGRHGQVVRSALARHPELASLQVGITTSSGGAIAVSGLLPRAGLRERLEQVVESTRPPVKVKYYLRVPGNRPGGVPLPLAPGPEGKAKAVRMNH